MTQTLLQQVITIGAVALATMLTRFLPFLLFPAGRPTPKYVQYLGHSLAPAAFGLLVVYCVRNVDVLHSPHGLPELLGILLTTVLHVWRRQMLLSIAGGTIGYMLLVQYVF